MASPEEIRNAKELKSLLTDIKNLRGDQISMTAGSVDSIKEILNLNKQSSEFDRDLLRNAKELNKTYQDSIANLGNLNRLNVSRQRILAKIAKSELANNALRERLTDNQRKALSEATKNQIQINDALIKQRNLANEIDQGLDIEGKKSAELLQSKLRLVELESQRDLILKDQLDDTTRLIFFNENLIKVNKDQSNLQEKISKQFAGTRDLLNILGAIPGLGGAARDALEDIENVLRDTNGEVSDLESIEIITQSLTKSLFSSTVLLSGLFTQLFISFAKINSLQVDIQRQLGEAIPAASTLTGEFSTQSDVLETANSLIEQFGLNINAFFSKETLGQATDLVQAVGLTAEQAGRLAFFSQLNNQNFEEILDRSISSINPLLSQRQILEQVGQISSFIAINFDNQVEAIVKAASAAKELGLELNQINTIADGLLDIESSIAAEFQAELLTGRQINLGRARLFALTNDLAGLTEEIGKNQELINSFTTGTRIEQQAIAEVLNLDVEALSNIINQQEALNKMSESERERKRLADLETLRNQESIAKSLQKITELSAVAIEPLLRGVTSILSVVNLMVEGFVALRLPLIAAAGAAAILKGQLILSAIGAFLTAAFSGNIAKIGAGLALSGLAAGIISRQIKNNVTPLATGGIVTSPTFALIGEAGPEAVIPLNRGGRNSMLSSADVNAIAKAVREGASQAQINLDGGRVSNRLQPSLAVNTRRYSV